MHSNSLPGWDFMVAYQQLKSSPGGAQQLTCWMGFHGGISTIQIKPRRHTATHELDGISWWHVNNSNQAQEAHSNSLAGWDFMVTCKQFKSSPGGTQQLTRWREFHGGMSTIQIKPRRNTATHFLMGFHGGMSAIQIKPRRQTATHFLDGIS